MELVRRLAAIEDIKVLKARYWRLIDTRQWDEYRTLFAPGMCFDFPELGRAVPAEDFIPWTMSFLEGSISIHRGYAPEIDIIDENNARGVWPFEDRIYWQDGKTGPNGLVSLQGDGHYFETYTRIDGVWKIATQRVTRLKVVTTGGAPKL
jgi:hypothetical protein